MSIFLRPEQLQLLYGHPAVNDEFSHKVKELDRRLKMNGYEYRAWDSLTDHQQDIFSDNLFLDASCAGDVESYVDGATQNCDCPDSQEELYHHSPALMFAIKQQRQGPPNRSVAHQTNESLEQMIDTIIFGANESEDS
jgi:hypothetical protein